MASEVSKRVREVGVFGALSRRQLACIQDTILQERGQFDVYRLVVAAKGECNAAAANFCDFVAKESLDLEIEFIGDISGSASLLLCAPAMRIARHDTTFELPCPKRRAVRETLFDIQHHHRFLKASSHRMNLLAHWHSDSEPLSARDALSLSLIDRMQVRELKASC